MLEFIVPHLAIHCHLERGTPCCHSPFPCLSIYPVVTVHLFLYTLLLLCSSPYLCTPCCYCALPISLYTLLLLCTSPYLCTPCCYCALPPISVHTVVTVHFPLFLHILLLQHTSLHFMLSETSMSLTLLFAQTRSIRHTCLHFTFPFPKHKTHPTVQFRTVLLSCFNISTTRNVITINISTVDIATGTLEHHFEVRCSFVYMQSEEFGRQFGSCRCCVIT